MTRSSVVATTMLKLMADNRSKNSMKALNTLCHTQLQVVLRKHRGDSGLDATAAVAGLAAATPYDKP